MRHSIVSTAGVALAAVAGSVLVAQASATSIGQQAPIRFHARADGDYQVLALRARSHHLRGTAYTQAAHVSVATLNVCPSGCAFSQIAPAIAAAESGDTIKVAGGTYRGGFRIDVSVRLVGAGAGATIIRGGGPVVTIGAYGASSEPTVSITGVTITGGVARSSPESKPFVGEPGVIAAGGGVEIPPNAEMTGGATVTISNSAISGNRVAPSRTLPIGPPCPGGPCPFAQAAGGGVDNWGTLTLRNTTVSDNRVGSASGLSTLASDADGGAIINQLAPLTITNSTISGNEASATAPNGRFADSGAIAAVNGVVTIRSSSMTNNRASLAAALPDSVSLLAVAGGVHIEVGASATIRNTNISANSLSMTNTVGDTSALSGGLHTDVNFELSNDVIGHNSVYSATLAGSGGNAEGDSGAGEMGGTISNTRFIGNNVTVRAASGMATASAGAIIFGGSLSGVLIRDNHVHAVSPRGSVAVVGGGLQAGPPVTLRDSAVRGNTADASGLTGTVQGGGIFNALLPNGPPAGPLVLTHSSITGNSLSASAGITRQGGGVFTGFPVTLTDSSIMDNTPDNCFGPGC